MDGSNTLSGLSEEAGLSAGVFAGSVSDWGGLWFPVKGRAVEVRVSPFFVDDRLRTVLVVHFTALGVPLNDYPRVSALQNYTT